MPEPEGVGMQVSPLHDLPRLTARDLYMMYDSVDKERGRKSLPWEERTAEEQEDWASLARLIRNHFRRTP